MKTLNSTLLFALAVGLLMFSSCKNNSVSSTEEEPEITNEVDVEIDAHDGEIGLTIDVREIFRKGYTATEADVSFPDHSSFNDILEIDPITNLAILRIANADLTEEQKTAFADGVAINIIIRDKNQMMLGEYSDNGQVLDDSNIPLVINSDLESKSSPLVLKEGNPYLLQLEGEDDLITLGECTLCFPIDDFSIDNVRQQFYLTPVEGEDDTYLVRNLEYPDQTYWGVSENTLVQMTDHPIGTGEGDTRKFVFEQDGDGWLRIRLAGTDNYLWYDSNRGYLRVDENEKDHRFRLISDNIDWSVEDKGTFYDQPIMPPGQIDFAFEQTIRNCSQGKLTTTVGNNNQRTTTQSMTTSESLALFSSSTQEVGINAEIKIGGEVYGVTSTAGFSYNNTYTTSETIKTENTETETNQETSEVSFERSLDVPPFTGVEVYDAVRTVENARTPFTQVVRVTASYKNDGVVLSGDEIMTQLKFNFISGVPTEVGQDYVDYSIRGQVGIDQIFEVETGADDIPDACS